MVDGDTKFKGMKDDQDTADIITFVNRMVHSYDAEGEKETDRHRRTGTQPILINVLSGRPHHKFPSDPWT